MSVYVDDAELPFRNMLMCHMTADTLWELHEFAERLGMKREWFQNTSIPHYDISKGKRDIALKEGAIFEPIWDARDDEARDAVRRMRRQAANPRVFYKRPPHDKRIQKRFDEAMPHNIAWGFKDYPNPEDYNRWVHQRDQAEFRGAIRRNLRGKDLKCTDMSMVYHFDIIHRIANEEL